MIVVETDRHVPDFEALLAELQAGDREAYDWADRIRIVSLETVARQIAANNLAYARL